MSRGMTVLEEAACRKDFLGGLETRLANQRDSSLSGDPALKGVGDVFRRAIRGLEGSENSLSALTEGLSGLRKNTDAPADTLYDIAADALSLVSTYATAAQSDRFIEVDIQELLKHTEAAMQDFRTQDMCSLGGAAMAAREVINDLLSSRGGEAISPSVVEQLQDVAKAAVETSRDVNPVLSALERQLGRTYQEATIGLDRPQTPVNSPSGPARQL